VVISEKRHYLRGRPLDEMNGILREGIAEGGYAGEVAAIETELGALQTLIRRSRRGDVAAVMSHVERPDIFAWLEAEGFRPVDLERLRTLVEG